MEDTEKRLDLMCLAFERSLLLHGIGIPEEGILAGREKPEHKSENGESIDTGWDNRHFPLNYGFLMNMGIPEIIKRAGKENFSSSPIENLQRKAIVRVYKLLQDFIYRHEQLTEDLIRAHPEEETRLKRISENCKTIRTGVPKTFEQGIQLFWFVWSIRQFARTSCIGRLDVHLRKLYEKDVPALISREEAFEVLRQLWEKLNKAKSGDTLMNVMLGGVDEDNKDISCDLSILMMEVTMHVAKSEPHINIRLHSGTLEQFRKTAEKMIAMGQGQGVIYDDEIMIPSLIAHGIPEKYARCYANDGCTEITIDGKSGIRFWQMEAMKTLELFLFCGRENPCAPHVPAKKSNWNDPASYIQSALTFGYDSKDLTAMTSFDEVYQAFMEQFSFQVKQFLDRIASQISQDKDTADTITSPLVSGLIPECLDTGKDPLRGGFAVDNYQLLSGSIPTVADSLAAIKEAVFEKRYCTMTELLEALEHNFDGREELRQKLLNAPKFGNDDNQVDNIAAAIADDFCRQVEKYPFPYAIQVLPGIYNIDFNLFASILGATPDGRHAGDAICAHYSPTPGRAKKGPTAVLRSASKADLARGCAASPVYITLPAGNQAEAPGIVGALIDGAHNLGLPLISYTYYDRKVLEDAMLHPDRHEDLIVRVWGFNARFIDLDTSLQLHIINRIL